jgi:uncharacterized protein (TIGR03546 family)
MLTPGIPVFSTAQQTYSGSQCLSSAGKFIRLQASFQRDGCKLSNNDQIRNGLLRRAFQPLNSPSSIALAIMIGILVGVIPKFSLLPWVIGIVAMLLPLNLVAFVLTVAVFSFVGPMLDPWFHKVGYMVLTDPSLKGIWESMAQSETFVWWQLNNTVVTGSLVASLIALLPGYFICKAVVVAVKPVWNHTFGSVNGFAEHAPAASS